MRQVLALVLLAGSVAYGQLSRVQDVSLSSVSSGDEVTRWVDLETTIEGIPYAENYAYADATVANRFSSGDIPVDFIGVNIIHTNTTDADTVSATLVTLTTDARAQICVWWPDSAAVPLWFATDGYLDIDADAQLNAVTYSAFCAVKDLGALEFEDSANPMYWVTVGPAWRTVPSLAQTPPDAGEVVFAESAYSIPENATTDTVIKFRRIFSSIGAVTADVDDSANTTCSTADFNFAVVPTTPVATTPVTGSWADTELGNIFLSVAMADLAADCLIEFEFENLTGGLQAGSDRQTATITILDAGGSPASADRFVLIGGTSSDLNDCTTGTPCTTIERAHDVAVAGDTIEIQVDGTGTGTYTLCSTIDESGSVGNVTTTRVRSGDTVNFYPANACPNDAIFRINGNYHHFDWTVGTAVIGDQAEWSQATQGRGMTHGKGFYIGGDNIDWEGGTIYGGSDSACNWIQGEFVDIDGVTFDLCGTNNDGPTNDRGDGIRIRGSGSVRLLNNNFSHGGHNAFSLQTAPAVVRGNTINQDWTDKATGFPGQKGGLLLSGAAGDLATAPYGPVLWEQNITKNVADSSDGGQNQTMSISGWELIIRRNLTCEADADAPAKVRLSANIMTVSDSVGRISYYHNTRKNAEGFLVATQSSASNYVGLTGLGDNFFAGNLIEDDSGTNTRLINWATHNFPLQGYANYWRDSLFRKNWVNAAELTVRATGEPSTAEFGAGVQSEWPANFEDNATTAFSFLAYTDDNDCNFVDLALAGGSNGIGDAPHLAEIQSNSSGTAISVDRARLFWDGEGIPGEVADYIAIYDSNGLAGVQTGIRQITDVNRATNVLTVDSSITVVTDDKIYLVLTDGTTVVDNMGAVQ